MVILEAMALFEVIQGEEKYGREGGYEWLRREEEWGCREARWALGPFFAVQKRMRRYWEKKWSGRSWMIKEEKVAQERGNNYVIGRGEPSQLLLSLRSSLNTQKVKQMTRINCGYMVLP